MARVRLGGYYSRVLGSGSSWFADLLVQTPLNEHDNFQARHAHLCRARLPQEHRRQAGPDAAVSGGTFLFLSPGVSYMLTQRLQAYGFVQLPLYQYVNGVQLTADCAVGAGLSLRF